MNAVHAPIRLPGPAARSSVEVVRDFESFLALEPEWTELADRNGTHNPFMRHEWIRIWWECFGHGKELHIVVVRHNGQVRAIAPLMLTRRSTCGLSLRRLEFISNSHTPRCDFILDGEPDEAYDAIWDHLARAPEWQVAILPQLPAESRTPAAIAALARRDGFLTGAWHAADAPFVRICGSWEGYSDRLTRKHRANMRNRFNRLNRLGPVQMEVVSSGADLDGALQTGLAIEAKAWKGRAGTAVLSRPDVRTFYERFARAAARAGWLRLHFLEVNGSKIAFDYSLQYRNRLYVLKTGYDPDFATYSPYNSLCWMKLRDAHARGLEEYDFLGTNDRWKMDWADATRHHLWLFVFSGALTGRLLHRAKFQVIPALNRSPLLRSLRDLGAHVMTRTIRKKAGVVLRSGL